MQSNCKQVQKEDVITQKWKEPNRCGRFPQQGKHEVLTKWAEGSSFHIQAPAFEYSNNLGGRVNQYSAEYHARRGRRSFMKATPHAGKTRGGATRMCLRVEYGGQVLGVGREYPIHHVYLCPWTVGILNAPSGGCAGKFQDTTRTAVSQIRGGCNCQ